VILRGKNKPALVNGKEKRINAAQYDVIEKLVSSRPHGATKDSIERVRTDARGILTRLCRDADWAAVIHMAAVTSGRYRID
jgi:nucleoside-diphosphate-sugar epimerase